jgi:tetratricopeptide (TPR) repeat protein
MAHDLLDALGEREIPAAPPERWAFLDTETTGLAGGSGTYAFLIGVGRITPEGFRVRQFFMRDYVEERSQLRALEEHLNEFEVLITYNGRSYDQPLLETRYRMTRQKPPFARLNHLDLLFGSRRLWKLRLESCRLIQLEQQILGFYREGDIAGELIPYLYFEYLRSHEAQRLVPVFHHNALDILTLACLTAIVPVAFRSTDAASLSRVGVRRGEDLAGIARWLRAAGEHEQALELHKRAVDTGLPDRLLFQGLWEIALLEKKLARPQAALQVLTELAGCRNEFQAAALEELAKFYEHQEKSYAVALEFTRQALEHERSAGLLRREERLMRRLAKPRPRRLL